MKIHTLLAACALSLAITPAWAASHEHMSHSEHSQHMTETVSVKGVIHRVSRMNRTVNITHDAVPALKWPAMTMDLPVTEDVDLKEVTREAPVVVHIRQGDDKQYRITKIVPTKKGHEDKMPKSGHESGGHGMKH